MEEIIQNEASQPKNDYVEPQPENTETQAFDSLKITSKMCENLLYSCKWLKFFAILGVVGIVLLGILGLFFFVCGLVGANSDISASALTGFMGTSSGLLYFAIAGAYYYPVKKSFALIKDIQTAMDGSQMSFESAADNYAKILKYCGILTIVLLVLYVIIFFVAIITGIALAAM